MTINNRRQNDNNNSDSGKEDDYEAAATQRHINDSDSDNAEEKRKMRARSAGRQQGSKAARQRDRIGKPTALRILTGLKFLSGVARQRGGTVERGVW